MQTKENKVCSKEATKAEIARWFSKLTQQRYSGQIKIYLKWNQGGIKESHITTEQRLVKK